VDQKKRRMNIFGNSINSFFYQIEKPNAFDILIIKGKNMYMVLYKEYIYHKTEFFVYNFYLVLLMKAKV
jgi:hypothetical protein